MGRDAWLVSRYLDVPGPVRNTMPVQNTVMASVRYDVSPDATAAIASGFLRDLIAAGHLFPDAVHLACVPSKLFRARKSGIERSKEKGMQQNLSTKIVGVGYDGRRDKHTRAMVLDVSEKPKIEVITEEHHAVTDEPSSRYLTHFVPETPIHPEKPALKIAQALHPILVQHESTESLQILMGDSTNMNTGWKGGSHVLLEKLLGRRLFWAIYSIHTKELPLRHLIAAIDGPTSPDTGFTGLFCSLLSKVDAMPYNPGVRGLSGG